MTRSTVLQNRHALAAIWGEQPLTALFALVTASRSREKTLSARGGRSRRKTAFIAAMTDSDKRSDTGSTATAT
jgi:hypothetical protein